ncbi:uncharacterized protein LOC114515963 [Dendronephthya gigantea]|uniref:uncharacterized protein LOC114515963 n=1 Tax=Dendronephthya gigantea TaxID=151771 RepID=UPI00106AAA8F|nr:uncharacterized protein LOC114515963 [Dendronephthya gigantea]
METDAVTTRGRRKRVHSTKCPCCSHPPIKPELKTRPTRKRKGDEIKAEGSPLLKTKRSCKNSKSKKSAILKSTDLEVSSLTAKVDKPTTEGRVLRSGRNTPVCIETIVEKEKPSPNKKSKLRKTIKQERAGAESVNQKSTADNDLAKSDLTGVKQEDIADNSMGNDVTSPKAKNSAKAKGKTKKQQNKSSSPKAETAKGNSEQKGAKFTKVAKEKTLRVNSSEAVKNRRPQIAKSKGAIAKRAKKTSAIEKLKVRAFDQLKEKLEIAFDRSSISVPECVQLLQKITSPNLSEIFESQVTSVEDSSSESLLAGLAGKSLPEIMSEGLRRGGNSDDRIAAAKTSKNETIATENLSKAAHALVSFKSQTGTRKNLGNEASSSDNTQTTQVLLNDFGLQNTGFTAMNQKVQNNSTESQVDVAKTTTTKQLTIPNTISISQTNHQVGEMLKNVTANPLSTSNQAMQQSNFPQTVSQGTIAGMDSLVKTTESLNNFGQVLQTLNPLIPTSSQLSQIANLLVPTTNQLFQTNTFLPATNPVLPPNQLLANVSAIASPQSTISPGNPALPPAQNVLLGQPQVAFQFVQAKGATPAPLPTTTAQAQTTPRFICPNPGALPQTTTPDQQPGHPLPLNQRLFLPKITPPIDQKTLGSNLPTLSIKSASIPTTSTNELPTSGKLRPILPREPFVSPTLAMFNPIQQNFPSITKASDITSNVKQAVKRLVNGRAKSTENPPSKQTLPDIASTFNKPLFAGQGKPALAPAQNRQDCSEMANKEQAIKALLSIGGEQQTAQQGAKGAAFNCIPATKVVETKKADDLLVVFDTDKGIFKVDDVTIDPQVNTIGKESYTCGKCGKIFTSLSYLARHIKRVCPDMTHRKWKCDHCEKAFRHPFGLQQHVFTHTGERPHKCSQCPKAFYSSNDLRRHSRIHSGERPYKCKHCGKTFATTISLKTHTFIHTGEKPHRCPHCPKTFATSSKLGRHIVTHSEQRPFACTQCPKTFNRSGDLRRHIQNLHQGKYPVENDEVKTSAEKKSDVSGEFVSINEHQTVGEIKA